MAILTPEKQDTITENSFALTVLANYVRINPNPPKRDVPVVDTRDDG